MRKEGAGGERRGGREKKRERKSDRQTGQRKTDILDTGILGGSAPSTRHLVWFHTLCEAHGLQHLDSEIRSV